ncbi:MAG TPA: hypothetical protein VGQ28_11025, partial [Thermoanaerobaculia bacterium]|nr:hypothetical protein [Thermoanaerobaculia bacterium]
GLAPKTNWLAWLRIREFLQEMAISELPVFTQSLVGRTLLEQLEGDVGPSAHSIAAGRVLCSGPPLWPIAPLTLGLLQVWPGERRLLGLRLQSAVASGISRTELKTVLRRWLEQKAWTSSETNFAGYFARDFARDFLDDTSETTNEDFARIESFSLGRVGARAVLANQQHQDLIPEEQLLSAACRVSLPLSLDGKDLDKALAQYESKLDPIWAALARHLARRATVADRTFLADLAQHPEKRDPPLAWGLQFIVRGDVLFDDGSIATLDELCDEAGVPRLPYLEDLPDEFEVDWDSSEASPGDERTPQIPSEEEKAHP